MQPQPLIGIPPHVIFDDARKTLGIFANVRRVVTGSNELNCRFEAKSVFSELFVPVQKSGDDSRTGMQRETRQSRRRTRRNAEKINENAFGQQCIVIGQNADSAARSQDFQYRSRRLILFNGEFPLRQR